MQPINMIMIYHWDKKLKKIACHGSWYNNNLKNNNIDLMSLAQRMHFLLDGFQMTAITLVSVINPYHINGLHLFWDSLYYLTQRWGIRRLISFIRVTKRTKGQNGRRDKTDGWHIIMLRHQHGYSWPSPTTLLYRPSLPARLQGYILYRRKANVCSF